MTFTEKEPDVPQDRLFYFPFLTYDWLSGQATRAMTPEQRGAFIDLLAHAWNSKMPCTLPEDDHVLAQLSGLGERWTAAGRLVRAQFQPVPEGEDGAGLLRNRKQWEVYQKAFCKHQTKSASGKAGAEKRWQGHSKRDGKAMAPRLADVRRAVKQGTPEALAALCHTESSDPKRNYYGLLLSFDRFMVAYPRKDGDQGAWQVWADFAPDDALAAQIMAGLDRHVKSHQWRDAISRGQRQFIPAAKNFLRDGRWLDSVQIDGEDAKPGKYPVPGPEATRAYMDRLRAEAQGA